MRTFVGTSPLQVVKRLAADQLLFSPIAMPLYLGSLHTLEGRPSEIINTLNGKYKDIMLANWSVWTPAQTINFAFVPGHYQVLFANAVSLGWNVYLSIAFHATQKPH